MSTISNLIFKGAKHYVTSAFGYRESIKTYAGWTGTGHQGTDYGTDNKKIPQYAIEDGYVFEAAHSNSDGANYVWVIYPRVKLAMLHYHLDSYKVKSGQSVTKGTLLGYTGMTGKATGIHLHLGIRNLSKLTAAQVKKMTWDLLRTCSYVDPEKVAYSEAKVEEPKKEEVKPAPTNGVQVTYTVKAGDTLSAIASKYGTTVDAIMKANPNHKNANLIHVGDVFVIPTASAPKPAETKPAEKKIMQGAVLNLTNKPLYASSTTSKVANRITGTFYAYDGQIINGRVKITISRAFVGRTPIAKYVTGWISI